MGKDSFLNYLRFERGYSEATIASYGVDIGQFEAYVRSVEEGLSVENADADLIRRWESSLMDSGYSSTSVNRKLSALRSYYRFLQRTGIILANPSRRVLGPKNKRLLPSFLREEEMNQLLDDADFGEGFYACRDKMILEMLYATGMRRAELISLNVADVDFLSSQIKVTGKRNKQRLIPFDCELRLSMEEYLKMRGEAVPLKSGAFFVNRKGERITVSEIYNLVRRNLSKVATLKKKSPHVLRHTFATTMLNNDAELEAVRELLGHSSLAATEIYTHTTFEELKKVYKRAHPRA